MADLGKDLLRRNIYLSPDQSRTWKSILDPNNVPDQVFDKLCSELEQEDQLLPRVDFDFDQQEVPETLTKDDLSEGQFKHRTTRSGKLYLTACMCALVRPTRSDNAPTKVSAISVHKPGPSCLVLRRLSKENKQTKVQFSENSVQREFTAVSHTDTIVPTQVTSKQYAYLVLMHGMIDTSFSPKEVFYLTRDSVTSSTNKYVIPLPVKDN